MLPRQSNFVGFSAYGCRWTQAASGAAKRANVCFTLHLVNFLYALNVGSGRFAEALISYSQTSVERG